MWLTLTRVSCLLGAASLLANGLYVASRGSLGAAAIGAAPFLPPLIVPLWRLAIGDRSANAETITERSIAWIWRLVPDRLSAIAYGALFFVSASIGALAFFYGYHSVTWLYVQSCDGARSIHWFEPLGEHVDDCQLTRPLVAWRPTHMQCLYGHAGDAMPAALGGSGGPITCSAPRRCPAEMVWIPAGSFHMGTSNEAALFDVCVTKLPDQVEACHAQARRQRQRYSTQGQRVDAFCIDRREVTHGQLLASLRGPVELTDDVCNGVPSQLASVEGRRSLSIVRGGRIVARGGRLELADERSGDTAAEGVTLGTASRYCQLEGKRLPSELEWEYAARGPDSRAFVSGDGAFARGEKYGCPPPGAQGLVTADGACTGPTEHEDRSWAGVLDLAGGANEWTSTPGGDDCQLPGDCRVVKGGGRQDPAFFTQPATVSYARSDCPWSTLGFRCATAPLGAAP